jgi:hypothetical protein
MADTTSAIELATEIPTTAPRETAPIVVLGTALY